MQVEYERLKPDLVLVSGRPMPDRFPEWCYEHVTVHVDESTYTIQVHKGWITYEILDDYMAMLGWKRALSDTEATS